MRRVRPLIRSWLALRVIVAPLALIAVLGTPRAARGQIAVVGSTVEEHLAAPGQQYAGTIIVRNLTGQPQPARVYQTDYTFLADGTSHFDSAGSVPRSNARWITTSASSITVPPNADVTVSYTVRVPAVDSLRGTYWSVILVEGAPTAPPEGRARSLGLGAKVRYAVQIATHLPATGSRNVRLVKQGFATDSSGAHALDIIVQNTGERAYRPTLWVELYDAAGVQRGRVEQQRGLLYPGTSFVQRFALSALPHGDYKAVVFADTGDDTVFAGQYMLTF